MLTLYLHQTDGFFCCTSWQVNRALVQLQASGFKDNATVPAEGGSQWLCLQ